MTNETKAPGEGETEKGGRPRAGRSKGTGTLERHGRTWRAVWTVDGVTYKRTTGTANKDEARRILDELVRPYHTQGDAKKDAAAAKVAERDGNKEAAAILRKRNEAKRAAAARRLIALPDAWEAFHTSLPRKPVTAGVERINKSRWDAFLAWMTQNRPTARALADVDKATADAFMKEIKARFAPKTFNDYRVLLSQVWSVLDAEAGLDGENPWRKIALLPPDTHTRRELTVEELARVIEPLQGEMRLLFLIGIYSGLRLGDAVNLDWGAVDLARGFVQVIPHKTAKHGTVVRVPLFPALASALAATPAEKRRGPILPELAKEYNTHNQYTCARVKKVFEAAGIETQGEREQGVRKAVTVGYHALRHTFVSLCANAGVPFAVVQAIVGHKNASMTKHYFHVSDDALRGVAAVLPDVTRPALAAPAQEVEDAVLVEDGDGKARGAVEAFRAAVEGLKVAGLSPADWREVSRILNAAKRRA